MHRVLITGANSFVGTSVEKWLIKTPDEFQVDTVDTMNDAWKQADYTKYDTVFHVAGIAHVDPKPEMAPLYYKVNRDLTVEIAKHAKSCGVKQFIFMSSSIVYHTSRSLKGDIRTAITRPNPNDFYGEWTSVYSQEGEIKANDKYPFSTLNLFRYSDEKNHIIIKYISESGYQQSREYIWNNYNGNLLELHMDSDPFVLNYRFRYDFAKKQFFLEISKLDDFSQYVGYTKIRSI